MEWWMWPVIPIVFLVSWFYTATVVRTSFPTLKEKAIVLLIAHPDDEAMFFSPTVLSLTRPELGNHVKILCLSNGNADGLGAVREKEIQQSAVLLGLRSTEDVMVLDTPEFPDSMTVTWSAAAISDLLQAQFVHRRPPPPSGTSSVRQRAPAAGSGSSGGGGGPPETTIDVLITFDRDGVSGHANHRSLHAGAVVWLRSLVAGHAGWESPVALYTLGSVGIARKYAGVLDAPLTLVAGMLGALGSKQRDAPDRLAFVSDALQYWAARSAMTQAHRSQMVWFRWGWISLGRYMVVNDLKRERPR